MVKIENFGEIITYLDGRISYGLGNMLYHK